MNGRAALASRPLHLFGSSSTSSGGGRRFFHSYRHVNTLRRVPFQAHRPILEISSRHSSTYTASATTADARSLVTRLKNLFYGTSVALFLVFGYYYVTDTRAGIHQWVVAPSLRWIYDDAEDAHEAGTKALKALYEFGIHPRERGDPDEAGDLAIEVCGPPALSTSIQRRLK